MKITIEVTEKTKRVHLEHIRTCIDAILKDGPSYKLEQKDGKSKVQITSEQIGKQFKVKQASVTDAALNKEIEPHLSKKYLPVGKIYSDLTNETYLTRSKSWIYTQIHNGNLTFRRNARNVLCVNLEDVLKLLKASS